MTDYNVTVGYKPTLGVTQQATGIVGPQGPTGDSYWISTTAGIHTLSNVGIGTTNPTSKLTVVGGASFTGVGVSVGIGTTNPTQTLDVRGNLRVSGTIQNASMIAFSVAFS